MSVRLVNELPFRRRYEPPLASISWPTTMMRMMKTSSSTRMQQMATASIAACSPSLTAARDSRATTRASTHAQTRTHANAHAIRHDDDGYRYSSGAVSLSIVVPLFGNIVNLRMSKLRLPDDVPVLMEPSYSLAEGNSSRSESKMNMDKTIMTLKARPASTPVTIALRSSCWRIRLLATNRPYNADLTPVKRFQPGWVAFGK
ncbi:hypothetical protein EVAR_24776_1 [Eumeta japonica]|uniref:Uncharacterized protein n=1 Tax=Eumeta variegata TaxID=151549 RepID=A0A4C1W1C8_EUMVA|nr:hypothetical protein EVAR_24776_1 [Eumeta japonica]